MGATPETEADRVGESRRTATGPQVHAASPGRRLAESLAGRLFPATAVRSRPLRRAALRRTLRGLAQLLDETPMAGRLWLMGGLAIGYARSGRALTNDLVDVDLGYADDDHEAMMRCVEHLCRGGFVPRFELRSNSGEVTAMRWRRDGVWVDLVRCFQRAQREYWITYLTDHAGQVPVEVEVETEVRLQAKVPLDVPLYGTTWLRAADLGGYLTEQYGAAWRADDRTFYGRQWDHVRDSPAVVRSEPWLGEWSGWRA